MKEKLLTSIFCKNCEKGFLKLDNVFEIDQNDEIRSGTVKCTGCLATYRIHKGILDLLKDKHVQQAYQPNKGRRDSLIRKGGGVYSESDLAQRKNLDEGWVFDTATNFDYILTKLNLTGRETVLEVGAGTCWATHRFAKLGCECVALDVFTDNKLELADFWFREHNVYFDRVLSDMNKLQFYRGSFDLVFFCSTLFCTQDILSSLTDINRILKPDGRVVLTSEPVLGIFQYRTMNQWKNHGAGRPNTIPTWIDFVKKAGFGDIQLFFPQSLNEKLLNQELIYKKTSWYYFVVKAISSIWKIVHFRQFVMRHFTYLLLLLTPVALPLLLVARKKPEKANLI
ncbi:MAG: class I SAM-dependent methyltransferase [Proteobacteria bacterium]|nr:class I SAM-dependent methyltransferase [Pseudomonadota bacterium]